MSVCMYQFEHVEHQNLIKLHHSLVKELQFFFLLASLSEIVFTILKLTISLSVSFLSPFLASFLQGFVFFHLCRIHMFLLHFLGGYFLSLDFLEQESGKKLIKDCDVIALGYQIWLIHSYGLNGNRLSDLFSQNFSYMYCCPTC